MIIHQATYGDKNGAYALLKTSMLETEIAMRLCNVTDLIDRPANGLLSTPVIRCFANNGYFMFIKSFPDPDPSVRQGRVFSHALFVELESIENLNDLNKLFAHFMPRLNKIKSLDSIYYEDDDPDKIKIKTKNLREAAAINALINNSDFNNTIVWLGEGGYWSIVSQIWIQLKLGQRKNFKFGVGFNPKYFDASVVNFIHVFEEYEQKWKKVGCCFVGAECSEKLNSLSSYLLAGDREKSKPLRDFIKTFGIEVTTIEDFSYLEKVTDTFEKLSEKTEFKSLIVLCDMVSNYSPIPKTAKPQKNKLLKLLILSIERLSLQQVSKLSNPNWGGFSGAEKQIGDEVYNWVLNKLFYENHKQNSAQIISDALEDDKKELWWNKAFSNGVKTALNNWESIYSEKLWKWFLNDPTLVQTIESSIPKNLKIEADFVNSWKKPSKELAQSINGFSINRDWFKLHALSILCLHKTEESIRRQLEIDTDPKNFEGLNIIGKNISDKDFILATLNLSEDRLIEISGAKVKKTPQLISQLDVKNQTWRKIWASAIFKGANPWQAIKKPFDVLFALLDEVVNGNEVEPALLIELSKSEYSDLAKYERRAELWQHFNVTTKTNFLNTTVLSCLRQLNGTTFDINSFELEIIEHMKDQETLKNIFEDKNISMQLKVMVFKTINPHRIEELIILVKKNSFSKQASIELGKFILNKKWKEAASYIASLIVSRSDLKPVIIECKALLSIMDRILLPELVGEKINISKQEWWEAFEKECLAKYPVGPRGDELWERAGGNNSDLLTTGTGKEIWLEILRKIKNGKSDISEANLLKEMLNDFGKSEELNQLNKHLDKA